jgi:hypothetical protein
MGIATLSGFGLLQNPNYLFFREIAMTKNVGIALPLPAIQ